jgi:nitronate monooxygenase
MLKLPVIVSPMFLVSTPQLVIEAGRAGVIGSFPLLNARNDERNR